MDVQERYDYIGGVAPRFADAVKTAALESHNEAEFRTKVYDLIKNISQKLGVDLLFREEYALATGRADAVYNRFIIEYEPPGSLRPNLNHKHTKHAIDQVKNYIEGVSKREKHDRNRLLGVAFDGHYYIFVRYHEGHWIVEEPLEVNASSSQRFLRALFSLSSGRALIPENLVDDFGSQNIYSQRVTRALYNALAEHSDGLTGKLFEQWRVFFGEVTGLASTEGKIASDKELRKFVRGMGLNPEGLDVPRFFFAVHTYFSFLVKNIARLVLDNFDRGKLGATPLSKPANLEGEALKRELKQLEDGSYFRALGLKNLLEGDFFSWYLSAWDADIESALKLTLSRLSEYNPATIQDDPHGARDLLKKLYHYLLPRKVRHDLGEFYTPDWLAERLLNQLSEPWLQMPKGPKPPKGFPNKRLLDPACGSGTFLILAIRALKANCERLQLSEADTLNVILRNVVGIDLNPLAVLAARVNYLLAIADLLPYRRGEVEIPVYLADSILTPARGEGLFEQHRRILETVVGKLPVPEAIDTRAKMERLTGILEEYVTGGFSTDVFLARCRQEFSEITERGDEVEAVLVDLFERLKDLHARDLDGIWARVLKNAFMPLFLEPFDYVVGNPPWINWESLPQGYRRQVAPLWKQYALFQHKGFDAILGKAKDDISTLMAYVATDRYLKDGGKLAFVITQSVWKTAGGGQGFRRFRIGEKGPHLRVLHVDDLSSLQVFEGASTRTSVFVCRKGEPTRYPVPYTYWKKVKRGGLDYDATLNEALDRTKRLNFRATPVDKSDPTSAWLTGRPKTIDALQKVRGKSPYRARKGITAPVNAVYWLEVIYTRPDGLVVVRNVTEGAKRKVESITVELESGLLYPLLRGREVRRWYAQTTYHILVTHRPEERLNAIPEEDMQRHWPKTWTYLKRFEDTLKESAIFKRYYVQKDRQGRIVEIGPFYSMFNVGEYTFARWKVVWREMSAWITCSVVGAHDDKVVIPDHKLVLVATDSEDEAHYLCAILNSAPTALLVWSYAISTQHSTHVLNNISIPHYDPSEDAHKCLSALSQRAHKLAPLAFNGDKAAQNELRRVEEDIDRAAAQLWGLSEEELAEIRRSLEELKG